MIRFDSWPKLVKLLLLYTGSAVERWLDNKRGPERTLHAAKDPYRFSGTLASLGNCTPD